MGKDRVRVTNPRPLHPHILEDTMMTLRPPDRWTGEGIFSSRNRRVATYTLDYQLTPCPGGSRITVRLEVTPVSLLARLAVGLMWRTFAAEHEDNYNDIVAGMRKELGEGATSPSPVPHVRPS
ncbi:MAG: hypothetical protein L3K15_04255 [Thermoplasmata archaeon]|nr:hypothetical protein [Thermoplasmata archaeon]